MAKWVFHIIHPQHRPTLRPAAKANVYSPTPAFTRTDASAVPRGTAAQNPTRSCHSAMSVAPTVFRQPLQHPRRRPRWQRLRFRDSYQFPRCSSFGRDTRAVRACCVRAGRGNNLLPPSDKQVEVSMSDKVMSDKVSRRGFIVASAGFGGVLVKGWADRAREMGRYDEAWRALDSALPAGVPPTVKEGLHAIDQARETALPDFKWPGIWPPANNEHLTPNAITDVRDHLVKRLKEDSSPLGSGSLIEEAFNLGYALTSTHAAMRRFETTVSGLMEDPRPGTDEEARYRLSQLEAALRPVVKALSRSVPPKADDGFQEPSPRARLQTARESINQALQGYRGVVNHDREWLRYLHEHLNAAYRLASQ